MIYARYTLLIHEPETQRTSRTRSFRRGDRRRASRVPAMRRRRT